MTLLQVMHRLDQLELHVAALQARSKAAQPPAGWGANWSGSKGPGYLLKVDGFIGI